MDDEYGIKLTLETSSFNKQVEKIKKQAKSIQKAFDPNDISGMIITGLDKNMKKVKTQAKETAQAMKGVGYVKYDSQSIQNYVDNFYNAKETAKQTKEEVKKVNKETKKIGNSKNFNNLTKGLDKMTSKIKKFGLSLLSIRSIWALVSRASSAYLAQDTALADKLQSVWAGLGAMLAPIIEKIANILVRGVAYINIFIKALTGVDLLARASAKSMAKAAKSAKGLNKALAGFDELNNLDSDSGSGIDAEISNPFANIKNEELPWADKVQAFGEWVKENKGTVIGFLSGLATALLATKTGLAGILATKAGTTVLAIASAIVLVFTGIGTIIEGIKDMIDNPSWQAFFKIVQGIALVVAGVAVAVGGWVVAIIAGVVAVIAYIAQHWEQTKEILGVVGPWIYNNIIMPVVNFLKNAGITILEIINGISTVIGGVFTALIGLVLAPFDALWKTVQDVFNGIKTIVKGVLQVFKGIFTGDMKTVFNGFKNIFKGVFDSLWGIAKYPLNLIISGINALIRGANKIKFDVPDWVPGLGGKRFGFNIPQIPKLNVGTNYVPQDQLAYIHKGEAVIPKKFNSQEYFGNGNDETNSLLAQVIEAINNIEVNPYTTIKDVGQTAVNYINGKTRQYGRRVI